MSNFFQRLGINFSKGKLIKTDRSVDLRKRLPNDLLTKLGFKKSKGSDYFGYVNKKRVFINEKDFVEQAKKVKKSWISKISIKTPKPQGAYEYSKNVNYTSADYVTVIQRVDKWIENGNPYDAFRIKLLTKTNSKRNFQLETAKAFNVEKIDDRAIAFDAVRRWALNFIGDNADYSVDINKIIVDIIPENSGGCRPSKEKIEKIDKSLLLNPRSDNNNCFFKVVQEELHLEKITKKKCNEIRNKFYIENDKPISASIAVSIFKEYNSSSFSIYDVECNKLIGDEDADIRLRLKEGHYMRYIGEDIINKCPKCKKTYKNKHSCIVDKYLKCEKCGVHHSPEKKCNKNKITFYQQQIKKDKTRYVISDLKKESLNNNVVHFDIETHAKNQTNTHQAYIIGFNLGIEFKYFAGDDCMEKFLDYFINQDEKFILNAYNGSRFDFSEICKTINHMNEKREEQYKMSFILNNSSIISLQVGKLKFFDLAKHTVGSLKSNLQNLKCEINKGDFDHSKGNRWSLMKENDKKECIEYLKKDVMGLKELYEKINTNINEEYGVNIHKFISTSQLTYAIGMSQIEEPIVLPTITQDEFFRKSIFGGRTYPAKKCFISEQRRDYLDGKINFEDIKDYIIDSDVVSLYPTAMAKFQFPIGKPFKVGDYVAKEINENLQKTGKMKYIGIYQINYITNKNLIHSVLPRRDDKGFLKWDLIDGQGIYTSIDIENAVKYGYQIEITGGYYFKKSEYIFKEYIEELFKKKQNSKKGTPAYIISKLFMNAFYGKLIQNPIYEESTIAKTNAEFWKFFTNNKITEFEYIGKDMFLSGIPRNKNKVLRKITKPSYLGAFVLGYSRRIMLDYINQANPYFGTGTMEEQQKNDFYYTDTDAIQIHSSNAKNIKFGSELGCLANDIAGSKIVRALYIAPKLYMLEYVKEGDTTLHYHFRGKGVSADSLNKEVFENMANGESVEFVRDFQMKRVNVKRNKKQQLIEQFSIIHQTDIKKILNVNKWAGRIFENNNSTPYSAVGRIP